MGIRFWNFNSAKLQGSENKIPKGKYYRHKDFISKLNLKKNTISVIKISLYRIKIHLDTKKDMIFSNEKMKKKIYQQEQSKTHIKNE